MGRYTDRELGMDRPISRRDFVHGAGALGLGFGALGGFGSRAARAQARETPYPPALTGMRGSHRGSFETAHALAMDGRTDWGPIGDRDEGIYDLVVVGAGVSGLAAAWFWRKEHPDDRILVLDNHDDFGGHAKRNELEVGGHTLLGHGGSQTLESPSLYSEVAKGLLDDLGIDLGRFETAFDRGYFARRRLGGAYYFDADTFGADRLVPYSSAMMEAWLPVSKDAPTTLEALDGFPLAETARTQLRSLYSGEAARRFPHWRDEIDDTVTYLELLSRVGVNHPQALAFLAGMPAPLACVGIDAIPALTAPYFGLPLPDGPHGGGLPEPYIHHFPDGNASVARLLVRRLIPEAIGGKSMEDVVTARALYEELDVAGRPTRLRLRSTVVNVQHVGDPANARAVDLVYVRGGKAERVRASRCVLACYNMVIPFLCPGLPDEQKQALRQLVKSPLVYTNVAFRHWRFFERLGICAAYSPGRWHHYAYLDFPVSLGGYHYSSGPDAPIVMHLDWEPRAPGRSPADQHREGRRILLRTSFDEIEREVRTHLTGMLGPGGFDPAEDIAALTVNRWPHGYAPESYGDPGEGPHVRGRRPFGRITIANSDAGARAYLDCAIDQAWRAVGELPS